MDRKSMSKLIVCTLGSITAAQAGSCRKDALGLPWGSSGKDSTLPMQEAQVRSLVRELDPTCHN